MVGPREKLSRNILDRVTMVKRNGRFLRLPRLDPRGILVRS
jgi:hypothetical protein